MIFQIILETFAFYCLAIACHELGHLVVFRKILGRDVQARFSLKDKFIAVGYSDDYERISPEQHFLVALAGVVSGMVPILLVKYNLYVFLLTLGLYVSGLKTDMRIIAEFFRKVNK